MSQAVSDPPLTTSGKVVRLAALAVTRPVEFCDRVRGLVEIAAARRQAAHSHGYTPQPWAAWAQRAATLLDAPVAWSDDDPGFAETRARIDGRLRELSPSRFSTALHADPMLARLAYFLTLSLRPALVVETGVALGVTSSYVLAALQRIGEGRLVSIDRPPLGAATEDIGLLIPAEHRARWTLHIGTSTRTLPRVLPDLPPIGLFIQDSLFTERNVRAEYDLVVPRLAPKSAILANAAHRTAMFQQLVHRTSPAASATLRADVKKELIGVSLYGAHSDAPAASTIIMS